jgi:hypothetical protein
MALLVCAAMSVACSKDVPLGPDPATALQSNAGATGTDSSGGGTPPSSGPVASVQVGPQNPSIGVGSSMLFTAIGLDARGAHIAAAKATWRSSNPDVLVASDSGVFYAKAVGTAKVYGSIDGHTDSSSVNVVARRDTTVTPPPPAVSSFNLTATVVGALQGSDTTRTEIIPGATVRLTRVMGAQGDTLKSPIDAGSAVADANGVASFSALDGGGYTMDITPPAGSPYAGIRTGFGPPHVTDFRVRILLLRK